jgi:hypothetical protein
MTSRYNHSTSMSRFLRPTQGHEIRQRSVLFDRKHVLNKAGHRSKRPILIDQQESGVREMRLPRRTASLLLAPSLGVFKSATSLRSLTSFQLSFITTSTSQNPHKQSPRPQNHPPHIQESHRLASNMSYSNTDTGSMPADPSALTSAPCKSNY